MKKLLAVILVLTTLLIQLLTGCLRKEYSNEDFTYYIYGSKKNDRRIEITGLTEAGNQKEVLVVPETIDGIPVTAIRKLMIFTMPNYSAEGYWHSQKLKKLYFYTNKNLPKVTLRDCKALEAIYVLKINEISNLFGSGGLTSAVEKIFIPSKAYFDLGRRRLIQIFPANTTYYLNYLNADNDGVFWIDNIEAGEKIEYQPPMEPTRDGYVFGGWYKEPECLNKWNFSIDTMPETPQGAENGFYELKLYAKWIKK